MSFFILHFSYFYTVLKRLFTPYIYILIFGLPFFPLNAQTFQLKFIAKDSLSNPIFNSIDYQRFHRVEKDLLSEIDTMKLRLQYLGYFNNRIDSIKKQDSIYTAFVHLGRSTSKIRIYYPKELVTQERLTRLSRKASNGFVELRVQEVPKFLTELVRSFEQEGKTFTRVQLVHLRVDDELLNANLQIELSQERKIDKILITGYENFPKSFLKHYLKLDTTTRFTTKKIKALSASLLNLPFVSEQKPAEVLFTQDSTYLYLYLKKEKANRFDGLVGFTSDEIDNRLLFNGYLDLELNNIFNGGEQIRLYWRNNGNDRQVFNADLELPFIFNSRWGPSFNLDIYKQDSTFLNTAVQIKINYFINHRNSVGAILNSNQSNNLLDELQEGIQELSSTFYGIGYQYQIENDHPLFRNKFQLFAEATVGNREFDGSNMNQNKLEASVSYLWNFNPKNYLYAENTTGLLNSDSYFTNELFRIGGVNSIRGFNEESIFASLYSYVNVEYRFAPNNNSYLYTISDAAYIRNEVDNSDQNIFSLGLGYAFSTNFGLLNLSYAIGKFDQQDFDFNNSRFHIKIISNF